MNNSFTYFCKDPSVGWSRNIVWPDVALPKGKDDGATLLEDLRFVDLQGFDFTIPRGFKTDGASIPRWLWRVCGHPLQSPRVYAALVHDFLYSGRVEGATRQEADDIYRELLVRFGWGRFRAWVEWLAIRIFGRSHWTESAQQKASESKT